MSSKTYIVLFSKDLYDFISFWFSCKTVWNFIFYFISQWFVTSSSKILLNTSLSIVKNKRSTQETLNLSCELVSVRSDRTFHVIVRVIPTFFYVFNVFIMFLSPYFRSRDSYCSSKQQNVFVLLSVSTSWSVISFTLILYFIDLIIKIHIFIPKKL